jgi:hypothetical protein
MPLSMRKLLKTLFLLQLPIVVWLLAGALRANAVDNASVTANNITHVEKQFYTPTSHNTASYATNEEISNCVLSVLSKTRNANALGWWAHVETIEQLWIAKSIKYLQTVICIYRFRSTDIIFPFHFFW